MESMMEKLCGTRTEENLRTAQEIFFLQPL